MKRTRIAASLLLAVVLSATLVSCKSGASETAGSAATPQATAQAVLSPAATTVARASYPLAVPSTDGRTVTLTRAPERIVSLSPGSTEILFAIGAGGSVVGTDRFSDFPDDVKALPKIDYSNPNIEALAALRPDLVIAATRQKTLVPMLEAAGMKALLLEEPSTVAGVEDRIHLIGQIVDHGAAADELAGRMQQRVNAVAEKVKGVSAGPRVYHEIDPKLFSAAPSSFVGDLYTLLKAQNIATGASTAFPQLSAEAIIRADPEVIVLGDGQFAGGTPDDVKRRPGWNVIAAVKNDRVYAVEDSLVSRPGPRIVDGLEHVAKLLYPDRFQ